MAEDTTTPDEQPASNTEATKVKRRLRSPSETMRERSEKHQIQKDKSPNAVKSGVGNFFRGFTWPVRALFRQMAKLGRFKVFRIIGLILFPRYFRNSWRELRQVTWPNARLSFRLTYAVLIFSILFGVIIAILDFGLDKLFKEFVIK